jgi:hypothetical protein
MAKILAPLLWHSFLPKQLRADSVVIFGEIVADSMVRGL